MYIKEAVPPFLYDSPYGLRVNLNNPFARQLLDAYKREHKIPITFPLDTLERVEFELWAIPLIEKRCCCTYESAKK